MRRSLVPGLFALAFAFFPHESRATNRTVTTLADSGVGSFRAALAASVNGDSINFAVTGAVVLTGIDLGISVNLTINGPGAQVLAISRDPSTFGDVLSIKTNGTAVISGLAFSGARGFTSGSAITNSGTLTLNACELRNNSSGGNASGRGAGLWNVSTGQATLSNCTFTGNVAQSGGSGGAIYNASGGVLFGTNCTFDQNDATGSNTKGGAVYNAGEATFFFCTFADNIAVNGSSIYNDAGAVLSLRNTLLGARVGVNLVNNFGTFNSFGYNLADDSGAGLLTQPTDLVNADPKLDTSGLRLNGGTQTRTIALTAGSAAIDKGKSFGLTTDQRGFPRPVDNPGVPNAAGGDAADIGAYEAPADPPQAAPYTVTTIADHNDGVCSAGDCTLREAIAQTNSLTDSTAETRTIIFAPSLTGRMGLTGGQLSCTKSATIIGPGARLLEISANAQSRVFSLLNSDSAYVISGLTIRDGYVAGTTGASVVGGGIYNEGTLMLSDCALVHNLSVGGGALSNTSNPGGTARGGAIFNSGSLDARRCTIGGGDSNSSNGAFGGAGGDHPTVDDILYHGGTGGAALGGAIYNDTTGTVYLENCTVAGNSATGGSGGAARFGGSGGAAVAAIYNLNILSVTSSTISANSAAAGAGGNSEFGAAGSAGIADGGLHANASTTNTISNTIIAGNSRNSGGAVDVSGAVTSSGFNLIGVNTGSTGFTAIGDQTGTIAAPRSAMLGPIQNNGGPTNTMLPVTGSPVIEQGYAPGLTLDQRGLARPMDNPYLPNATGGDGSDIGAVEADGSFAKILRIARSGTGQDVTVSFEGTNGKTFRLERKFSISGSWSVIPFSNDTATGHGVGSTQQITDVNAIGLGRAFYRIVQL